VKAGLKVLAANLVAGGCLFLSAGTLGWWNGWAFLALFLPLTAATQALLGRNPGLVEERKKAARLAPAWDRALVLAMSLLLPVAMALAGLDRRWGFTAPLPGWVSAAAWPVAAAGAWLSYRAMAVNPFFSSFVRIQEDRGHVLVEAGPYRFVRHPGYAGALLFNLGVTVLLGSPLAFTAGVVALILLVHRTAREDRFLAARLPGYREYSDRVRYRMVPLAW